jgi:hypothetical protein
MILVAETSLFIRTILTWELWSPIHFLSFHAGRRSLAVLWERQHNARAPLFSDDLDFLALARRHRLVSRSRPGES